MKKDFLADAIGKVDADLLDAHFEEKETLQTQKKPPSLRFWRKWGITAACICLSVALAVGVIYQIQNRINPDRPDILPETDEDGTPIEKQSIYSISGATVIDLSDAVAVKNEGDGDIYMPEEYIRVLKNNFQTAVGTAQNIRAITVKNGEYIWHIATFDLVLTEIVNFSGVDVSDTIRCVTATRCLSDGSPARDCGVSDLAMKIIEDPQGFFVARDVGDDVWTFGLRSYPLSDYADHYIGVKYDCTETHFNYYGTQIAFDDIRLGETAPE